MKRTLAITAAVFGLAGMASGQIVVKNQGFLPFSDAPINYRSEQLSDPIAILQKQLDRGEARLEYEPGHGYLKSVLRALGIAVNSQTLVFSKTSFQYPKISPERPRALYFNDDVYVGQVHDGKSLEFVSFDPMQGAIFYMLDEHRVERPRFERAELDCMQCHVAASTHARRARRDGAVGVHPSHGLSGGWRADLRHRAREPDEGTLGRLVRDRELRQADPHGERDRLRQRANRNASSANSIPRRTSPAPATSWRIWCWRTRRRCTT